MVDGDGLLLGRGVRAVSEMSMSWGEIANLTHKTQVLAFGFCSCEEQEQFPYDDCPREGEQVLCGDCLRPDCKGCE